MHRSPKDQQLSDSAPTRYQWWLTGALILLLLFAPILEEHRLGVLVLVLFGNVIILAGLYAVSWNSRRLAVGLLLALPTVVSTWSFIFNPTFAIGAALNVSAILFFVYTLITILQHIFRTKRVGIDELFGALNVYILVGVSWGLLYCLIEALSPGAFALNGLPVNSSTFIYYSFSTLGTLGLGDVRPILPFARSLSIVEMLVGLFFIAALFGKLVAVFRFENAVDRPNHRERPAFDKTVRNISKIPRWGFVFIVAGANLVTSIANDKLQMPLFLDTWATSVGAICGGLWIGVLGGVLYNLLMAFLVWGSNTWVWAFNTTLVALLTRYFWVRGRIDINRPLSLVGCGLVIAVCNAILGIIVTHLAGLPRNPSTLELHTLILNLTQNFLLADLCQQVVMESIDKVVSLAIAAIVVFAFSEFRKTEVNRAAEAAAHGRAK